MSYHHSKIAYIDLIFVALAAVLIGILLSELLNLVDIDPGVSGLVGSAIGAGLTVFGAIWVSDRERRNNRQAELGLLADAVSGLKSRVDKISEVSKIKPGKEIEHTREELKDTTSKTITFLKLSEDIISTKQINDFEIKSKIFHLNLKIDKFKNIYNKEYELIKFTDSRRIIEISQEKFLNISHEISQSCDEIAVRIKAANHP